jgi:hypothetical protein
MADYYLHLEALIEEENTKQFEPLMTDLCETVSSFAEEGWKFILALKSEQHIELQTAECFGSRIRTKDARCKSNKFRRYVHIWDVPDPPDVAKVMQLLADNTAYGKINALVVREIQNLLLNVSTPAASKAAKVKVGDRVIELQRQISVANLGEYLFTAGILAPVLEELGWLSFGRFQSITGRLNTVTELWRVADDAVQLGQGAEDKQPLFMLSKRTAEFMNAQQGLKEMLFNLEKLPDATWQDKMKVYMLT